LAVCFVGWQLLQQPASIKVMTVAEAEMEAKKMSNEDWFNYINQNLDEFTDVLASADLNVKSSNKDLNIEFSEELVSEFGLDEYMSDLAAENINFDKATNDLNIDINDEIIKEFGLDELDLEDLF